MTADSIHELAEREARRQRLAALQAAAALHGVTLRPTGSGIEVMRWAYSRECASLAECESLLRAMGVAL